MTSYDCYGYDELCQLITGYDELPDVMTGYDEL